jgi:hypothetical protein
MKSNPRSKMRYIYFKLQGRILPNYILRCTDMAQFFFCNKLLSFYRFPILDLNFKASWVFLKSFDKWHNQQATSLYYLLQSGTWKVTKTYNDFWKLTECLFTSFYWHFFRLFTGQRGVWIKNVVFVNQHIWQNQCTFLTFYFWVIMEAQNSNILIKNVRL